jgi:aspartyl-tRNA(Asn)/glutamyl-tRNA(Gln) amidotransferase subunit C
MSKLTKENVEKVSKLARLKLNETEIAAMTDMLSAVLSNFEQIAQVDTSGVKPLVTPTEFKVNLREDVVNESLPESDKLLQNAPHKSGRLFKVPPVV